MTDGEQKLTLLGHFGELRRRLVWSAIAVGIGVIICLVFYEQIFVILEHPAAGMRFSAIDMTERISSIMLVCFAGGIILAMPVLVYQGIMFVSPALTRSEKKWVYIIIPWVFVMFLGGVAFGYFMLAPWTIWFLYSFGAGIAEMFPRISNYISFLTKLLLLTGIVFEMPVISTFLAHIGVLNSEWLTRKRPAAIILAFIASAVITPPDPITQILLAIPLVLLYEVSIWLAKAFQKKETPAPETLPSTAPNQQQ